MSQSPGCSPQIPVSTLRSKSATATLQRGHRKAPPCLILDPYWMHVRAHEILLFQASLRVFTTHVQISRCKLVVFDGCSSFAV